MPFACSQCHAEVADESESCAQCGAIVKTRPLMDAQPESDSRFPFWTILPWCLFGAALLFLLPYLLRHPGAGRTGIPGPPSPSATTAAALPPPAGAAAKADPAGSVPLSVTLYSASSGKHISVGAPVMISAYAALPPGQSATVAVSYDKDQGPKSFLSVTQGSLASTSWTPPAPGHYRFTASALDSRKISVFSHPLSIWADAPAPSRPTVRKTAEVSKRPATHHRTARKPESHTEPVSRTPAPYHVAAASFPVQHIADTLAGALRRRGFNASVRPSPGRHGRQAYTVETGSYIGQADAQKQVQTLQHDGYPAYLFRAR